MPDTSTRDRLLDAADKLFSANGFSSTSLRAVTAEAGANLAAVNYHFGSKDGLLVEVLRRKIDPVNQERIRRLDVAIASASDGIPPVESIVEAFVRPPLERFGRDGRDMGLLRIVYLEDVVDEGFFHEVFGELVRRFRVLEQALPHLGEAELGARFHFMVSVLLDSMSGRTNRAPRPLMCPDDDLEATIRRLITFLTAGFHAPATDMQAHPTSSSQESPR